MRLSPLLVEKPWGVERLPQWLGFRDDRRIGEIWYEGTDGATVPLLVKNIFTSEKLSVQVHPCDASARARGYPHGKDEGWYIVHAEPGAMLGIGTHEEMTDGALDAASRDGSIEACMDWYPVRPGDYFYIPPRTVHAIGPGVGLVEVQQNIDLTYRLYDYGRPRPLHLDDAVAVADAHPYERENRLHVGPGAGPTDLPAGDAFTLSHWRGPVDPVALDGGGADGGPWFCVPLEGEIGVAGEVFARGACAMIADPAALDVPEGAALLIARPSRSATSQ